MLNLEVIRRPKAQYCTCFDVELSDNSLKNIPRQKLERLINCLTDYLPTLFREAEKFQADISPLYKAIAAESSPHLRGRFNIRAPKLAKNPQTDDLPGNPDFSPSSSQYNIREELEVLIDKISGALPEVFRIAKALKMDLEPFYEMNVQLLRNRANSAWSCEIYRRHSTIILERRKTRDLNEMMLVLIDIVKQFQERGRQFSESRKIEVREYIKKFRNSEYLTSFISDLNILNKQVEAKPLFQVISKAIDCFNSAKVFQIPLAPKLWADLLDVPCRFFLSHVLGEEKLEVKNFFKLIFEANLFSPNTLCLLNERTSDPAIPKELMSLELLQSLIANGLSVNPASANVDYFFQSLITNFVPPDPLTVSLIRELLYNGIMVSTSMRKIMDQHENLSAILRIRDSVFTRHLKCLADGSSIRNREENIDLGIIRLINSYFDRELKLTMKILYTTCVAAESANWIGPAMIASIESAFGGSFDGYNISVNFHESALGLILMVEQLKTAQFKRNGNIEIDEYVKNFNLMSKSDIKNAMNETDVFELQRSIILNAIEYIDIAKSYRIPLRLKFLASLLDISLPYAIQETYGIEDFFKRALEINVITPAMYLANSKYSEKIFNKLLNLAFWQSLIANGLSLNPASENVREFFRILASFPHPPYPTWELIHSLIRELIYNGIYLDDGMRKRINQYEDLSKLLQIRDSAQKDFEVLEIINSYSNRELRLSFYRACVAAESSGGAASAVAAAAQLAPSGAAAGSAFVPQQLF